MKPCMKLLLFIIMCSAQSFRMSSGTPAARMLTMSVLVVSDECSPAPRLANTTRSAIWNCWSRATSVSTGFPRYLEEPIALGVSERHAAAFSDVEGLCESWVVFDGTTAVLTGTSAAEESAAF